MHTFRMESNPDSLLHGPSAEATVFDCCIRERGWTNVGFFTFEMPFAMSFGNYRK